MGNFIPDKNLEFNNKKNYLKNDSLISSSFLTDDKA